MSDSQSIKARIQRRRMRVRDLEERIEVMEDEMQEHRQLSRRVAELTDLIADLLVPLAQNDQAKVNEIVDTYRASI
jgi:hypothetical protein